MIRTFVAAALCLASGVCAASEGTVVQRHPDGRPAAIEALGHTVRFGTQSGTTCDDAIVLADARDESSRIRSQHVWLDAVHPGWFKVAHRIVWATTTTPKHAYSRFNLKDAQGRPFDVCFDVSDPMVAEAAALEAQPKVELPPITETELPRQLARCGMYYDLMSQRVADAGERERAEAMAKLTYMMAMSRGATRDYLRTWIEEIQSELAAGGSPTLIAEWDRCPALFREQLEKLQAEGKIQPTPEG